jgi:hypothetical protein
MAAAAEAALSASAMVNRSLTLNCVMESAREICCRILELSLIAEERNWRCDALSWKKEGNGGREVNRTCVISNREPTTPH